MSMDDIENSLLDQQQLANQQLIAYRQKLLQNRSGHVGNFLQRMLAQQNQQRAVFERHAADQQRRAALAMEEARQLIEATRIQQQQEQARRFVEQMTSSRDMQQVPVPRLLPYTPPLYENDSVHVGGSAGNQLPPPRKTFEMGPLAETIVEAITVEGDEEQESPAFDHKPVANIDGASIDE